MHIYLYISYICIYILFYISGAKLSRGGVVEALPHSIWKNEKTTLILEKTFQLFQKPSPTPKIPGYIYIYIYI